jgi:MFS superfamily sulfate permease-like transporter
VTGAGSRTAVSDSAGGKTQVTGLVAAAAIAVVLLFFTRPLQFLPGSALGAVLIAAGLGLFDWRALVRFRRIGEGELLVCVTAMLGVVALGALNGIGLAVALAMLVLLFRTSRPADAVLGQQQGLPGFVDLATYEGAAAPPGLLLYRFAASVIFYNAAYFGKRALTAVDAAPGTRIVIIDASPIVHIDSTGADAIVALAGQLAPRGIRLVIGGALPRVRQVLERSGAASALGANGLFPTFRAAVEAHQSGTGAAGPRS